MKILILLHVHSLLSLLYEGWADAESTGGLIHLWKQVVIIIIFGMPHICGMDTYGMKIMPQMSGIATFQDIYGMLIFEDEHAIDV